MLIEIDQGFVDRIEREVYARGYRGLGQLERELNFTRGFFTKLQGRIRESESRTTRTGDEKVIALTRWLRHGRR